MKARRIMTEAQQKAAEILDALYAKYGVTGLDALQSVATSEEYDKAEYAARVVWGKEDEA